jgi:PAS domain S-box-containing protein
VIAAPSAGALRYRAVLDALDQGFCVIEVKLDRDGHGGDYIFLETNPAFERLTGIAQAVSRSMRDITPAHEQHWFDRYAEVALTGKPCRFEARAEALAGGRWFDVFAFRVDEPEQRHVAIFFADVTARKIENEKAAAALAREREANALLDAIFEGTPIGLAFVDRDLRFRRINARLADMNGLPASDHIGRRPDELLGGLTSLDLILERWKAIIETGEPWLNVELQGETAAQPGIARSWSENFFPVRVGNKIVGLGAVVEETTARDQARDALRESAAQLRRLIDHMAAFVSMLDRDGTLLEVNEPALTRVGLRREQVLGRKYWECPWWTHDPIQQSMIEEWCRRAREGETIRHDVVGWTAGDGRVDIDFMLVPVFHESGVVTHLIASGVDISDRKRMELALRENEQRLADSAAALRDADRRKDDFLATLAHELRNPLAPIRNGIQILRLISAANPTLERTSQMMERQMQHLVRLVDDLLDVSRITRGKIKLRRDLVLLNEVVSSALESCQALFEPHGHTLSVTLSTQPLRVLGDPDRLRQVFANLLSNAAKFTPKDGSVWVSLEGSGGIAIMRVKDTGIGIPPERLKNVFEMFAQVNTPAGNDGLGIGLSLARQLVILHGGRIEAGSEGVGKGSEFIVFLPLADLMESSRDQEAPTEPLSSPRKRVLIVDDNVDAAESLAQVLKFKGHIATVASGGREAVDRAREDPPDIILLDLGMPGMDGLTAARLIRQQPGGAGIRIIALTGWGQERDRQRTREAGMSEHLVKPVDPEELLTLLEGAGASAPSRL